LFYQFGTSFYSVSQDQTAMLWKWNISQNSVDCIYVCRGHKRSVECVGVNHDRTVMATGSWDTMLKLWSTSKHFKLDFRVDSFARSLISSVFIAGLDTTNSVNREGDGESASKQARVEEGKYHVRVSSITLL